MEILIFGAILATGYLLELLFDAFSGSSDDADLWSCLLLQ